MTDKQIVVDGVDVSECEHVFARTSLFKEKNFVECTAFFLENEDSRCNCSDNPNCYYKQLKRKERECEESKSVRDMWMSKCEQETKTGEFFQDRFDDLKKTLVEIKEIAEGMHDLWINKTPYTDINNLAEHLLECELNRIRYKLDEISEVISE